MVLEAAQQKVFHAATMLFAVVFACALAGCSGNQDDGSASSKPAPATTPALLDRGQYLAQTGNCGACHTRADGAPFAGGVEFQTPFGTIYSANITPDAQTGIGNWTYPQFLNSLRHGVRPGGQHLYPVFPYTAFTKITDDDAAALFAYLKGVTAVNAGVPQNVLSFPFSQRWLLGTWKVMFFKDGVFQPTAGQSEQWNRGAYLVTALGHCSACHSPRNALGAERTGKTMSGGVYNDQAPGGAVRPWSAPNLTSAPQGLKSWSVEETATYLKTGTNSYATTFGPMNAVILNSTRHLSDADVQAMAVYLKSLPAIDDEHGKPANAELMQAGETLYNVNCGTCHQPDGMGAPDAGPRLVSSLIVQASDPASLINSILYGPNVPDPLPAGHQWRPMEAYGEKLSDEEIAALASYLRGAWNNSGGEVSPKQVAQQR